MSYLMEAVRNPYTPLLVAGIGLWAALVCRSGARLAWLLDDAWQERHKQEAGEARDA